MIDRTTLPLIPADTTLTVGQRFIVVGENFEYWPDEIVLGYNDSVLVSEMPSTAVMRLVEKTSNEMVFEVTKTSEFHLEHNWTFFAAGFGVPRTLLEYDDM